MTLPLTPKQGIELSESQRIAWLRLIRSDNIGPITFIDLIKRYGTASNALEALPELIAKSSGAQPQRNAVKSIHIASANEIEQELESTYKAGARIICMGEPDYPHHLRLSDAPPPVLTLRGKADLLSRPCVAFVGSRNASLSGIKITQKITHDVAQQGYTIISGFARGIDTAAHKASITQGTVAVFAGGINHIYPYENKELAEEIIDKGGALISEMPWGWKPRAQDFPRRNRIVAGLSLGLVVVEAARRSGSLISARLANEMGRLVFAVPGSPLDLRSEGANHLIQQGALLITKADDIINALSPLIDAPQQKAYTLDEKEETSLHDTIEPTQSDREKLLNCLDRTPTDIDEIIRFTQIDPGALQLLILEMSLNGQIERDAGNRISLI